MTSAALNALSQGGFERHGMATLVPSPAGSSLVATTPGGAPKAGEGTRTLDFHVGNVTLYH